MALRRSLAAHASGAGKPPARMGRLVHGAGPARPRPACHGVRAPLDHGASLHRGAGCRAVAGLSVSARTGAGELAALGPDWATGGGYWLMTPEGARTNPATAAFRDWLLTEVTRGDGAFA